MNITCISASLNASSQRQYHFLVHCFLAVLGVVSCTTHDEHGVPAPLPNSAVRSPGGGGYRIQIGDLVDVFVLEDSSFNGTFAIRPSGDIIMPKVGRVGVQGLSLSEAEVRIKNSLQANQLRQATVIVDPGTRAETAAGGLTLRLSGEIVQTGRVTVRPLGDAPVSAYQAIIDSGGFKPFANKRKSYILRNSGGGVLRINVNFEAIEMGRAEDPPMLEGDCIVVPKKVFGL
ncbi:polysaccharide biosynthesis/export family protein [Prosthecobacter sp.]|uniref:polysaccharide biosynthesis/export family protein n=1 Tax=Prosthecobacter sp. TaxID=1965333 RepID=UPI0025EF39B9|nr:polysaccharide biosynthesis/export family protein [Prosthecobacter sp.]